MVEQIQVIMNMFEKIRSAYRKFLKYANRQSVTKKMKGLEGKRSIGLSRLTSDRTQENSMKHQQGSFKLEIMESWPGTGTESPGKMVMAPILSEFKMDNTLEYMV